MLQLCHPAQVRVDPVGERALLLLEDHVVAVAEVACEKARVLTSSVCNFGIDTLYQHNNVLVCSVHKLRVKWIS